MAKKTKKLSAKYYLENKRLNNRNKHAKWG
jgi:hypothetical protein